MTGASGKITGLQVVLPRQPEPRDADAPDLPDDRDNGVVAVFEVTRVERYPKSSFPTDVVFGAIDHAGLRLITCGGDYEHAAHRYSDNVVAFARLTGWHPSQQQ